MIEILKNIPFFADLPEEDLNAIMENIQLQYFPADHEIFQEAAIGDIMYIIKRGKVQVIRTSAVIAELSDNDFFGEMALVSEEPRNATVKTLTDLEVLTLNKADFQHLMSSNPTIASMISYEVVNRANDLN